MQKIIKYLLISFSFLTSNIALADKHTLIAGWMTDKPFVYEQDGIITGIDIDFLKAIAKKAGLEVDLLEKSWNQGLKDLEEGNQDIALAASFSAERNKFAYFTLPYREEVNSLLTSKAYSQKLLFTKGSELINEIKKYNFRLGVIQGCMYVDHKVNEYIAKHKVETFQNISSLMEALKANKIDGFILSSFHAKKLAAQSKDKLVAMQIDGRTDQYFMLSRKTVSEDKVNKVNNAIQAFRGSEEYYQIISKHLK